MGGAFTDLMIDTVLTFYIGDDCIAMLKNCPDVATCLLMLCGALTDLTIDTVLTFYWR